MWSVFISPTAVERVSCPIYVLAYCWNISNLDQTILTADIQQASNAAFQGQLLYVMKMSRKQARDVSLKSSDQGCAA